MAVKESYSSPAVVMMTKVPASSSSSSSGGSHSKSKQHTKRHKQHQQGDSPRNIVFDDFREAYSWLSHNTPLDATVMAWWDYGYQIASLANRTTVVDNNTWNNTHIATVGRALVSSEQEGYKIARQLGCDYVMVVFGGLVGYGRDDIARLSVGASAPPAPAPARLPTSCLSTALTRCSRTLRSRLDGTGRGGLRWAGRTGTPTGPALQAALTFGISKRCSPLSTGW